MTTRNSADLEKISGIVSQSHAVSGESLDTSKSFEALKAVVSPDLAYDIAAQAGDNYVIDPEKEKKVVRKIDFLILPLMGILMACQLMDKSTNSYASIMGLRTDLEMTTRQYSWVSSSFYLAFLIFEYPANVLMQIFPLAKVLGTVVTLWGVVVCCHAACNNYSAFVTCRVLLGALECFVQPCFVMMTSQWYRKGEQHIRSSVWVGMQGFGTMLGSGIAYGFYHHNGSYSMPAWRLLYVVCGVITIFFGLIVLIHVPDIPSKAWFFTEEERIIAVERIRENRTGFGSRKFKPEQVKEAFKDPVMYLFFFYMFGYGVSNGALGNFGSILLNDKFKFSTGTSLLLNMVGSGIDILFPPLFSLLTIYVVKIRLLMSFFINAVCFMGVVAQGYSPNATFGLWGYFVTYWGASATACMNSSISTNIAGTTKKFVFTTVFYIGFAAGNLIGPQAYKASEAPKYPTAGGVMIAFYVFPLLNPLIIWAIFSYRNKKRDATVESKGTSDDEFQDEKEDLVYSYGDMTDLENPKFRYVS